MLFLLTCSLVYYFVVNLPTLFSKNTEWLIGPTQYLDFGNDLLTFAAFGDWGGQAKFPYDTNIELGIAGRLMQLEKKTPIKFILALGDNFYRAGVKSENDKRFNETYESVFPEKSLPASWYVVAGNHDYRGNVSAQIAYTKRSSRWNFPAPFYDIKINGTNNAKIGIIMIDAILLCGLHESDEIIYLSPKYDYLRPYIIPKRVRSTAWKWLVTTLNDMKNFDYILVGGHYPIWSVAEHGPTKCLVERLLPLLEKHHVSAYISGHDHTFQHLKTSKSCSFFKDKITKQKVGFSSTCYRANNELNFFVIGSANYNNISNRSQHKVPNGSLQFHWTQSGGLGTFRLEETNEYKNYLKAKPKTTLKFEFYTSTQDTNIAKIKAYQTNANFVYQYSLNPRLK